jgi:hypothetical protein
MLATLIPRFEVLTAVEILIVKLSPYWRVGVKTFREILCRNLQNVNSHSQYSGITKSTT